MEFQLSEEPRLLKDSAERLMLESHGFDRRPKYQFEVRGSSETRTCYAELGFLKLRSSEVHAASTAQSRR
ncbi:hypothetical protein ABIB82_007612 [Bradyrhizobium sp. i1.8.4]|uniref:hypothetical protein n=1 Tax=unclassified Bradyrhizobium TaxID=2631580 RepID=UPI003D19BFD2